MKSIFNSLGSNYENRFVWEAIKAYFGRYGDDGSERKNMLEEVYGGKATLTYKGRDAIEWGLRALGLKSGDGVMTQAFACYAVEEGIRRAGAKPIYVDIGTRNKIGLNLTVESLEEVWLKLKPSERKKVKAVIVQHMLGYPAEVRKIEEWCKKRMLALVEDLAQGVGAKTKGGKEVGGYGDLVIFSFGRDKIVDAVTGGAMIIKDGSQAGQWERGKDKDRVPIKATDSPTLRWDTLEPPSRAIIKKDLIYPLMAWSVRQTYDLKLGKGLHKLFNKLNWWSSPTLSPTDRVYGMPESVNHLVRWQWKKMNQEINHRRKIALIYDSFLAAISPIDREDVRQGSCLRYPLMVQEPHLLIEFLAKENIHIGDRWYGRAVDWGSIEGVESIYEKGSCRRAEAMAESIVNLPTHRLVRPEMAREIARKVKSWQDTR